MRIVTSSSRKGTLPCQTSISIGVTGWVKGVSSAPTVTPTVCRIIVTYRRLASMSIAASSSRKGTSPYQTFI